MLFNLLRLLLLNLYCRFVVVMKVCVCVCFFWCLLMLRLRYVCDGVIVLMNGDVMMNGDVCILRCD